MTEKVYMNLFDSANAVCMQALSIRRNERVLIITNPEPDTLSIAQVLYNQAAAHGAIPVLIMQPAKEQTDFADDAVIKAIESEPEVLMSISTNKMGKDRFRLGKPMRAAGQPWEHIFHYLLYGVKSMRAIWCPAITPATFERACNIDYRALAEHCARLSKALEEVSSIHVAAPSGTDLRFSVLNRRIHSDDGMFTQPGRGGNIPAGEVFISPVNGSAQGTIVFDGSLSTAAEDLVLASPVAVTIRNGMAVNIDGVREASILRKTLENATARAQKMGQTGELSPETAELYALNTRNLGEFGIGLNPSATICGSMLEDEKVLGTCHFALGSNYDNDAPSLIHLDGLVKNPTITIEYKNGTSKCVVEHGRHVSSGAGG